MQTDTENNTALEHSTRPNTFQRLEIERIVKHGIQLQYLESMISSLKHSEGREDERETIAAATVKAMDDQEFLKIIGRLILLGLMPRKGSLELEKRTLAEGFRISACLANQIPGSSTHVELVLTWMLRMYVEAIVSRIIKAGNTIFNM